MKEIQRRFYDLYQFLGGFFHQDWKGVIDWQGAEPNFEAVVRFYKTLATPAELAKTIEQLRRLLDLPLSEQEFNEITTHDLGAVYTPRSRGLTKRQWLEAVLTVLKEPTVPTELKYAERPVSEGWKEYVDEETKRLLNIK